MVDHNSNGMSESEEMYLITIAQLVERGFEKPIPISRLAKELEIQPVSANQMVHNLAEAGLVTYTPYRGVELTPKGSRVTSVVLRRRRLWEVFLVDHLGTMPVEADALACRLEHITPREVIDQLDNFLGHPSNSPQGLPIPTAEQAAREVPLMPLGQVPIGERRLVLRLEADDVTCAFLESVGLVPGSVIRPLAVSSGGEMLLEAGAEKIFLAADVVGNIMVAFDRSTQPEED